MYAHIKAPTLPSQGATPSPSPLPRVAPSTPRAAPSTPAALYVAPASVTPAAQRQPSSVAVAAPDLPLVIEHRTPSVLSPSASQGVYDLSTNQHHLLEEYREAETTIKAIDARLKQLAAVAKRVGASDADLVSDIAVDHRTPSALAPYVAPDGYDYSSINLRYLLHEYREAETSIKVIDDRRKQLAAVARRVGASDADLISDIAVEATDVVGLHSHTKKDTKPMGIMNRFGARGPNGNDSDDGTYSSDDDDNRRPPPPPPRGGGGNGGNGYNRGGSGYGGSSGGGYGGSSGGGYTEKLKLAVGKYEETLEACIETGFDTEESDVLGHQDIALDCIKTIRAPDRFPHLYTPGSKVYKPINGILFHGPPGTGKTLIASLIAAKCCCTFFNVTASTLLNKWVGEAEHNAQALFDLATRYSKHTRKPSIVFVDEIDGLLRSRDSGSGSSSSEVTTNIVNIFIMNMDGIKGHANNQSDLPSFLRDEYRPRVIIIGGTNNRSAIDSAVLDRLRRQYEIGLPSANVIKQYIVGLKDSKQLNLAEEVTEAEIERIANLMQRKQYGMRKVAGIICDVAQVAVNEGNDIKDNARARIVAGRVLTLADFAKVLSV